MTFWSTMFAFASAPRPEDDGGSYGTSFTLMRVAAWLMVATFALSVLVTLVVIPIMAQMFEDSSAPDGVGAFVAAAAIFGLVFGLAVTGGALYWIGWTMEGWATNTASALTSARVLAIVGIVIYGLSTLITIIAFATTGTIGTSFTDDGETTTFSTGLFAAPLTVAKLVVAILLLTKVQDPETTARFEA